VVQWQVALQKQMLKVSPLVEEMEVELEKWGARVDKVAVQLALWREWEADAVRHCKHENEGELSHSLRYGIEDEKRGPRDQYECSGSKE
jgi:hypothetical protein